MSFHKTYSARGTVVNYAGMDLTPGKSDGEYLTISYVSDRVNIREGMDGNASIAVLPTHSVTVTYTLFPESESAQLLQAFDGLLRNAERTGNPFAGDLPFAVAADAGVLIATPSAVLQSVGDQSLGENTGTIDFVFYCQDARIIQLPENIGNTVNEIAAKANIQSALDVLV